MAALSIVISIPTRTHYRLANFISFERCRKQAHTISSLLLVALEDARPSMFAAVVYAGTTPAV